jgi:N-acetylneuraminic acid mutarotase
MIGNNFYTGSGALSSSVQVDDLYEYDSLNNSWISKSPIPAGVELAATCPFVINGKVYLCDGALPGSYNYNTTLWQYDPVADFWTAMDTFPGVPGYTGTSFSIGPYGFMGLTYSPYFNTFYRYNSQTNVWDTVAPFPGLARQSASSFVIGSTAYVCLGQDQNNISISYTDCYRYDTLSGRWSAIATFPGRSRRDCASFVLNGKGYIVGGIDSTSTYINNETWEYDPDMDQWTQLNAFPQSGVRVGSYASNGSTFAIVGMGENSAFTPTDSMWKTSVFATSVTNVDQNVFKVWHSNNTVHILIQQPLSDAAMFSLYDLSGKKVSDNILPKGQASFDIVLSEFASGMYIYNISSDGINNATHNGKIVLTD